jgi:uncharacterized membrane protein YcaP (DUF421 family)
MFDPQANLLEILLRVAVVYVVLLAMLRLSGKRQLGQLSPMDLLTMLLISETVSPALTAGDDTLTTGMVAAATLVVLTVVVGWLSYRFGWFERLVEGLPARLIENGQLERKTLERERITRQELDTALHRSGVQTIDEVALGTVEPDGEITIVKR